MASPNKALVRAPSRPSKSNIKRSLEHLRHGIFQERQAEFATDALRALLLEWAGYDTKVFEFISTDHTAKNIMIAATKHARPARTAKAAESVRAFAAFYGITAQALARQLGFALSQ